MTDQDHGQRGERYTHGYGAASDVMGQRTADVEASFFIPHLSSGDSVLDCGCGPGTISLGIARHVSSGSVTGIDIAEGEVKRATDTAKLESIDNANFQVAGASDLPFPDSTFDAVWSSAMLEHLAEPRLALDEMFRVLKPGGVIGIRSIDFGGHLWSPSLAIDRTVELISALFRLNGGNAEFGREHPRLLRESGFERIHLSASYESRSLAPTPAFAPSILREETNRESLIGAGLTDDEELGRLLEGLPQWVNSPDSFFFIAWCEAVAWKPGRG